MKTIIHIGQHKTATTSIQHCLQRNKSLLVEQGLYVPESLCGNKSPSHFLLNLYSLDEKRFSPMKEELKDKPEKYFADLFTDIEKDVKQHYKSAKEQGCKEVIWSNEGLYLLNSIREYNRLTQLFEPFSSEIKCVCCFRELSSYKKSYKKQLRKHGVSESPEPDSYRYLNDDSWLFDYSAKRALLAQSFNELLFFEYDIEDNVSKFFEKIDYKIDSTLMERLNVSK